METAMIRPNFLVIAVILFVLPSLSRADDAQAATEPPAPLLEWDGVAEALIDMEMAFPVSGIIRSVEIDEGTSFKKDDVLIVLEHEALKHQAEQVRLRSQDDSREQLADLDIQKLNAKLEELEEDDEKTRKSIELEIDIATVRRNQAAVEREVARSRFLELQQRIEYHHVKPRVQGAVEQIWVSPGQYVKAGDPVCRLINLDRLKIDLDVPSDKVAELAAIKEVLVYRRGVEWSEQTAVSASITILSATIDPESDTRRIRIELENRLRWPAGTFVTIRINAPDPTQLAEQPDQIESESENPPNNEDSSVSSQSTLEAADEAGEAAEATPSDPSENGDRNLEPAAVE